MISAISSTTLYPVVKSFVFAKISDGIFCKVVGKKKPREELFNRNLQCKYAIIRRNIQIKISEIFLQSERNKPGEELFKHNLEQKFNLRPTMESTVVHLKSAENFVGQKDNKLEWRKIFM